MVEIIPKKRELPVWFNILFYFSLALFISSIVSYFILGNSLKVSQKTLEDLEKSLVQGKTPEKIVLEKEILRYQKKIEDFSPLFGEHLKTSAVFEILQKKCHPKVWFSQFGLNSENAQIAVLGETDSFESLEQQLLIFKREGLIKSSNLEGISLTKEGRIEFSLSLSLDPKILK